MHSELVHLLDLQRKARQDEIYGGFTRAERAEFEARAKRISALEVELRVSAVAERSRMDAAAEQRREWNKASETDSPQAAARQSYRSREKDSAKAYMDAHNKRESTERNGSKEDSEES